LLANIGIIFLTKNLMKLLLTFLVLTNLQFFFLPIVFASDSKIREPVNVGSFLSSSYSVFPYITSTAIDTLASIDLPLNFMYIELTNPIY
jgi:hypothetical protein